MKKIDELMECPKCGANWDEGDVYEYFRKTNPEKTDAEVLEMAKLYGWSESNKKHFQRLIGVEIQGQHDGVLYWQCPDCGTTWNRLTNKEEAIW